jgi:hypothetical protein
MYSKGEPIKFTIIDKNKALFSQVAYFISISRILDKTLEPAHTGNILQSLQHPPEQISDLENRGSMFPRRLGPIHYTTWHINSEDHFDSWTEHFVVSL